MGWPNTVAAITPGSLRTVCNARVVSEQIISGRRVPFGMTFSSDRRSAGKRPRIADAGHAIAALRLVPRIKRMGKDPRFQALRSRLRR